MNRKFVYSGLVTSAAIIKPVARGVGASSVSRRYENRSKIRSDGSARKTGARREGSRENMEQCVWSSEIGAEALEQCQVQVGVEAEKWRDTGKGSKRSRE